MFGTQSRGFRALLLLVAFYCVSAVAITGNLLFFLYDDRPSSTFLMVWLAPIALWYLALFARLALRRRPVRSGATPLRRIGRYTRLHRSWLGRAVLLIVILTLWASAFTILKINIPRISAYHADPALIALDRLLFGTDPWRLTHAVIGQSGTVLLDRAYAAWFFVLIGFMAWMIATRNAQLQVVSLLTLVTSWLVLGVGLATVLASVGPCYVEDFFGIHDFAPLMDRLRASPQPLVALQAMDYLHQSYGKTAYAAGIAAMPSMHVAMAVWFVLVAREGARSRLPMALAAAYALIIFTASIHLGWHYASDGIVSALLTPLIWRLTKMYVTNKAAKPATEQRTLHPCAS